MAHADCRSAYSGHRPMPARREVTGAGAESETGRSGGAGLARRIVAGAKGTAGDLTERLTSGSEERTPSTIREIASSGGQARYLGAVPSVQATTAKDVPGSQDWFYLLKCRECKPAVWGITKIGRGSTPVEHAHELGWREPPNGKKKWARCLCPTCATAQGSWQSLLHNCSKMSAGF